MGGVLTSILVVAREAFLLMRRDRVFLPAVAIGLVIVLLADLVSDWSIEEFHKALYDVGFFGFQLVGWSVAVFWGIKSVTDSRGSGALEVQLAAPVPRTAWLVGKYLGLALALILLWAVLLAGWAGYMELHGFGHLTRPQLGAFAFLLIGWLVVAAVATFFASFTGQAVAMFSSVALLLAGLGSSLIANTLSPETGAGGRAIVRGIARVWDLQQFNLVARTLDGTWPDQTELATRAAYGGILILLLISVACVVFSRRDVNP